MTCKCYEIFTRHACRLQAVSSSVSLEVHAWDPPSTDWDLLWDLGALAALNDCLYRSQGQGWGLMAALDLDEVIVGRRAGATLGTIYQEVGAELRDNLKGCGSAKT